MITTMMIDAGEEVVESESLDPGLSCTPHHGHNKQRKLFANRTSSKPPKFISETKTKQNKTKQTQDQRSASPLNLEIATGMNACRYTPKLVDVLCRGCNMVLFKYRKSSTGPLSKCFLEKMEAKGTQRI